MKVRVASDTFYYPGVSLIRVEVPGDATLIDQPRIVAEVISRSTRAYDLVEKRAAYRSLT
jgi:Uma2 family endonuclease